MLFTGMMHLTSKQMCIFNVGCIKHIIQLSKYNKWFMLEVEYAQAASKNIIGGKEKKNRLAQLRDKVSKKAQKQPEIWKPKLK